MSRGLLTDENGDHSSLFFANRFWHGSDYKQFSAASKSTNGRLALLKKILAERELLRVEVLFEDALPASEAGRAVKKINLTQRRQAAKKTGEEAGILSSWTK